jgi:DNA adenine methylase
MITKSFIKWLGGKSELAHNIFSVCPKANYKRFLEPFAGSMVISLNCEMDNVVVNDLNKDLVNLYKCVKNSHVKLIKEVNTLFKKETNNIESYRDFRIEFNNIKEQNIRKAALFIYLNRHGFNGLCRYNTKGEFNVSFGGSKTVNPPIDTILHASYIMKSKNFQICNKTFEKIMSTAREGDLIYCDPPYDTFQNLNGNKNFSNYIPKGFDIKEQIKLAELAYFAAQKGAVVVISNHNTFFINRLYRSYGANIKLLEVKRNVSCKSSTRKKVSEVLAVFSR